MLMYFLSICCVLRPFHHLASAMFISGASFSRVVSPCLLGDVVSFYPHICICIDVYMCIHIPAFYLEAVSMDASKHAKKVSMAMETQT